MESALGCDLAGVDEGCLPPASAVWGKKGGRQNRPQVGGVQREYTLKRCAECVPLDRNSVSDGGHSRAEIFVATWLSEIPIEVILYI